MSDTRQYGRLGSFVTVCEDLRDIGRRLDALEAGRRASEPEQREVGWYPVRIVGAKFPCCLWWDGTEWRDSPGYGAPYHTAGTIAWIGPRLDLPEGRR